MRAVIMKLKAIIMYVRNDFGPAFKSTASSRRNRRRGCGADSSAVMKCPGDPEKELSSEAEFFANKAADAGGASCSGSE